MQGDRSGTGHARSHVRDEGLPAAASAAAQRKLCHSGTDRPADRPTRLREGAGPRARTDV